MQNQDVRTVSIPAGELAGLLDMVLSWQHPDEVHLRGCPSTTYYIAICSKRCMKARILAGEFLPEQKAELPVSGHEFARSSIEAY